MRLFSVQVYSGVKHINIDLGRRGSKDVATFQQQPGVDAKHSLIRTKNSLSLALSGWWGGCRSLYQLQVGEGRGAPELVGLVPCSRVLRNLCFSAISTRDNNQQSTKYCLRTPATSHPSFAPQRPSFVRFVQILIPTCCIHATFMMSIFPLKGTV